MALEFGDGIDDINQRSLEILDGKVATIRLRAVVSLGGGPFLEFHMALGSEIGFTEGHVNQIANLSDKQFNAWMLDALERAEKRTKQHFVIDKELEREELPKDIHPAITIQERENRRIITMDERRVLKAAFDMQKNMDRGKYRVSNEEFEKYEIEK